MSPRRHGLAAALAAGALVLLAVPTTLLGTASAQDLPDDEAPSSSDTPSDEPSTEPPSPTVTVTETVTAAPTPEGAFEVDDAQLRWGLNDETNNRAFAPGTFNFLSAGKVPNPGRGGQTVRNGVWSGTTTRAWFPQSGDVRIEKQHPDGSHATATFAGLSTTVAGTPMSGTHGPFSGHQVVIDGGTGEVDSERGTASISWTGSFSVLYYSGMTLFTVTDPVLSVTPSGARLTATLGGYASSMADPAVWTAVPARRGVLLADLPEVDLGAALGFSAQPRYRGVRYAAPASAVPQVTSSADWGAWPRPFLDFMGTVGSSAYWYSSGGSADANKVPHPVTVSYAAGRPITPPVDTDGGSSGGGSGGTDDGGPSASPSTPVNPTPPPVVTQPPGPALPSPPPGALPPVVAPTAPAAEAAAVAAPAPGQPGIPPTTYALTPAPAATRGPDAEPHWPWWLGSALLLAAAALTLHATRTRGRP
ncbi:hypothetical protein ABFT23_20520 [Nocardioides sp. C4-1]|uniref:hypothetical protein n=1 Tax=Nocardioides sp. C4-1 TaxID=3151851 RepID=UPI003265A8C3